MNLISKGFVFFCLAEISVVGELQESIKSQEISKECLFARIESLRAAFMKERFFEDIGKFHELETQLEDALSVEDLLACRLYLV